jgi:hypothetical protein
MEDRVPSDGLPWKPEFRRRIIMEPNQSELHRSQSSDGRTLMEAEVQTTKVGYKPGSQSSDNRLLERSQSSDDRRSQRPNPKKNMVYGTLCRTGFDYNLTLCPLQSRLQHIYQGQPYVRVDLNPMPESTLFPSQGLWIWPQSSDKRSWLEATVQTVRVKEKVRKIL